VLGFVERTAYGAYRAQHRETVRVTERRSVFISFNAESSDIISVHFVECYRTLVVRVKRQPAFGFPVTLFNRMVALVAFVLEDGQGLVQLECQRGLVCLDGRLDPKRVLRGDPFTGVE